MPKSLIQTQNIDSGEAGISELTVGKQGYFTYAAVGFEGSHPMWHPTNLIYEH